ncbi:MAG: peptide-methionine (S)-S-oxide reductase MsrA [Acidobacteriia bacterium]|nr:peptide-methionine (S)-S-oxide reductase MsrA [Terriglobia bacterium]
MKWILPVIPLAALVLSAAELPPPAVDIPAAAGKHKASAVLAGGCFWGVEAVFEHLKGVSSVVAGYAGGNKSTARYELVETGRTGHAESVEITYDPSQISYGKLLQVYFAVAHDPTELNRQGPDEGTQYRSAIFYSSEEQQRVAEAYIQQLNGARAFSRPIVTQLTPLTGFYAAEEHHQHFIERNPENPYVVYNDLPKLAQLRRQFPELLKR